MMDDEDDGRRPPPPRTYEPHGRTLFVPANASLAALRLLKAAGQRESGLFMYGRRSAAGDVVTSVRAPKQDMRRGNFHVSPAAISEMCFDLADDIKLVAQVHSHPGFGVEHSRYDDEMIASRRALSLVAPYYGCGGDPWPEGLGVHEWQIDYWHLLPRALARRRIQSTGDADIEVVDFR